MACGILRSSPRGKDAISNRAIVTCQYKNIDPEHRFDSYLIIEPFISIKT
jgi:hypothetical protein